MSQQGTSLKTRVAFVHAVAWSAGLTPLVRVTWRALFGDRLGANPIEALTHWSGLSAVVLLIATLAVTPLRRVTGINELQRARRTLGLFAFLYAALHFLVWMVIDQGLALEYVFEDLTERPFIVVGALSLLLLVPLAVTSTRGWVRRLGRRWVCLHRLVYVATALAILHYTWKQKADIRDPLIAWSLFVALMLARLVHHLASRRSTAMLLLVLPLGACATAAPQTAPAAPAPRPALEALEGETFFVYTSDGAPASFEQIVAAMAEHDAVFVGEEHNDGVTHRVQAKLVESAYITHGSARPLVLSLEMFERDVQYIVDEYMQGLITEDHFLRSARPWDNYRDDYRPMVEFARAHDLEVVAANAPRRYANRASRLGRDSLEALSSEAKRHLPPLPYPEPSAAYQAEWDALMGPAAQHMSGTPIDAQTLWDASMGEAVAASLERTPGALVLHMAGGFHVENGTGTPEALAHYRPSTRTLIVAARPADDPSTFDPELHAGLGDFVVLTRRP